ncbi:MAG: helix-turn-helix domain-containing protein [Bacilli bacterium]|nr:helix-turn-helix domain-containing protein [Bacilli bacterium]
MKEIGESFRNARETIGISKEEVVKDLNITESQLDNLEDGNVNAFKDVFFLKEMIRKYSRYLNLDEEANIDKFNDFIFSYTSKIPVDEILEQTREINILESQKNENKIVSPYTAKKKSSSNKMTILFTVTVVIIVILILFLIKYITDKRVNKNSINYNIVERSNI